MIDACVSVQAGNPGLMSPRDIMMANRLGKVKTDRPRAIKTAFESDWVKKDLIRNRPTLTR